MLDEIVPSRCDKNTVLGKAKMFGKLGLICSLCFKRKTAFVHVNTVLGFGEEGFEQIHVLDKLYFATSINSRSKKRRGNVGECKGR